MLKQLFPVVAVNNLCHQRYLLSVHPVQVGALFSSTLFGPVLLDVLIELVLPLLHLDLGCLFLLGWLVPGLLLALGQVGPVRLQEVSLFLLA